MNLLWDFRLFSYQYRNRGVGQYALALATEYVKKNEGKNIFVLGESDCIPELASIGIHLIEYKKSNWKNDLINIPKIILTNKIDIYHYWIALGPLYHIGMGLFNPCKTIATIYDMGTELWDVPFLKSVKKSWYWRIQKKLLPSIDRVVSISHAASAEIRSVFPNMNKKIDVIYKPIKENDGKMQKNERERYFIALGGSPHKNVASVVKAFDVFNVSKGDFRLIILGEINRKEEGLESVPENVEFDKSMENYQNHLKRSSGLIFCSFNEGLGIPPLEAMSNGCPVLVSDIPSLKEICTGAAVMVNPLDIKSIADGMIELVNNNYLWSENSLRGASKYQDLTKDSAEKLENIYQDLYKT